MNRLVRPEKGVYPTVSIFLVVYQLDAAVEVDTAVGQCPTTTGQQ